MIEHAQIAVIGKLSDRYSGLAQELDPKAVMIDLVVQESTAPEFMAYYSVCWNHPQPQGERIAQQAAAMIDQVSQVNPALVG